MKSTSRRSTPLPTGFSGKESVPRILDLVSSLLQGNINLQGLRDSCVPNAGTSSPLCKTFAPFSQHQAWSRSPHCDGLTHTSASTTRHAVAPYFQRNFVLVEISPEHRLLHSTKHQSA